MITNESAFIKGRRDAKNLLIPKEDQHEDYYEGWNHEFWLSVEVKETHDEN